MAKQMENEFTFTWIIENFSLHRHKITTSAFDWDYSIHSDFYVCLDTHILDGAYVGVSLKRNHHYEEFEGMCYGLEVLNCKEKTILTIEKCKIEKQNTLKRKLLLRFLINDTLILKFTFNQAKPRDILPPIPYKNGLFADVVLRAGGAEFKVHKAILWARWPKLAEKLDAEKTTELGFDIAPNVLEAILRYVYTGNMDFKGFEFSRKVCAAAIKYELPHSICAPIVAMSCRTPKDVGEVSFQWPIKNFSSLPINTVLHSFAANYLDHHNWYLILHVTKDTQNGKIFDISIRRKGGSQSTFVRSTISFDESTSSENEHIFHEDEDWKCAEFLRSISTDPEDIVILNCELKFSMPSRDATQMKYLFDFSSSVKCRHITRNMNSFFQGEPSGDVDIVVGGRTYCAHKFILSARSPVFAKMLESETGESKRSSVHISDADPYMIYAMLQFLYGNYVGIHDTGPAVKLYAIADKYDIPALKKKCSYWLKSHLHTHNICDVLQLADTHSDADLYDSVLEYINAHAEQVFSSDEWKECTYNNNNLCAELLKKAIIRNNPIK